MQIPQNIQAKMPQKMKLIWREAKKMAICVKCGREFDVSSARRSIGRIYGAGTYNNYYPDGDVCEYCAIEVISADYNAGIELIRLMGSGWDDD